MFRLSVFHIPKIKTLRAVMLVVLALGAGALFAEGKMFWQEGGVVVCESTWAIEQAAASDDSGGVFVVWYDKRGENGSVRAQHVDRDGNVVWQKNGVFVGDGDPRDINQLSAISDGRGGLVAIWQAGDDLTPLYRHQVTAQRLDAAGSVLWDSSGVVVAGSDSGFRYVVATVSDGRGGAIVAWTAVARKPAGIDSLVVQRIDSLGNLCWGNPGLVLATDTLLQTWLPPYICSDNTGGACITWDGSKSDRQTIVQHIDSAGCPTWPGAGVLPFASHLSPTDVVHIPGGYMIAGASSASVSAQRIDEQGQLLWGPDGSSVYSYGFPYYIRILSGRTGSGYVIWSEERIVRVKGIYAQLLDAAGERQWDSLGVDVGSTNEHDSYLFGCVVAGAGFIASWLRDSGEPTHYDTYAQHVDSAGRLLWGDPGLGVATDSSYNYWEPSVVTDARQGAIITWGYTYGVGHVGLSVQRVGDVAGVVSPMSATLVQTAIRARPSPARGGSALQWPAGLGSRVAIFDASGRQVTILLGVVSREGDMRADWNGRDGQGRRVPPGVYVCTLADGTGALTQKVVLTG